MTETLLTFDIGQSGYRTRLTVDGDVVSEAAGAGYRPGMSAADILSAAARTAAAASKVDRFDRVVGGMTGVYGHVPDTATAARLLAHQHGTATLTVADDAVTSYLGAIGYHPGVVVAAGTGLVALGHGPEGRWARVDGVGAMIGDEGAGWWIGRQGLIAAFSAVDGRAGGSARLRDAAIAQFGPLRGFPAAAAQAASPITLVAGFARSVAVAARDGDAVARDIWARAAGFIARAICAAADQAGLDTRFDYTIIGGIGAAADLLEPILTESLAAHHVTARPVAPHGTSLDGGAHLAALSDTTGLGTLVRSTTTPKDDTP